MEDLQKLIPGFPRIAPQVPFLQVAPNMNMAANMLPTQHLQPTGQLEYKVCHVGRGGLAALATKPDCQPQKPVGFGSIRSGIA